MRGGQSHAKDELLNQGRIVSVVRRPEGLVQRNLAPLLPVLNGSKIEIRKLGRKRISDLGITLAAAKKRSVETANERLKNGARENRKVVFAVRQKQETLK